jgi:nitrate reductase gamma subunit
MHDFVSGPLVWIAFASLLVGAVVRLVLMYRKARKDKVVLPYLNGRYALRSITHWLVPYNSVNMRRRAAFTLISFSFHICLLATPVFLYAHVMLWKQNFGVSWWTLPAFAADVMTLVVIAGGLVFLLRRLGDDTVRYVSTAGDFWLLALVLAPYVTGFLAHRQIGPYDLMLQVHIVTGCLWLAAIPFTRLVHMLFFPLTRAYMGSEFGFRNARDW